MQRSVRSEGRAALAARKRDSAGFREERAAHRAAEAHKAVTKKGSLITSLGNDCVKYMLSFRSRDWAEAEMNGDGSKQHYVSTFRMHIKPPHVLSALGNGPGTTDTKTSDDCTDTGKVCMREELNDDEGCVCVGKTSSIYHDF